MKCSHCQAQIERVTTAFHIDRRDYHAILDSVPTWVYSQCGEPFFEEREVDAIQDLIRSVEEKTRAIALTA